METPNTETDLPDIETDDPARLPVVKLQAGRHKRVRAGHPWVFSNEIEMTVEAKAIPPGSLVTLTDNAGGPIGVATFNPHPLISARLLSRDGSAQIDADWLARRLTRALSLRERLFDAPFYRLVHAEADGLPGLIVDRYDRALVVQCNTAGMDALTPVLLEALQATVAPETVIFRNDSAARTQEGLEPELRTVGTALDGPIEVVENGVRFLTDPMGGQKTGWFFDHRETRARAASLAKGLTVLDCYAYLGGFGLQAAVAGASAVTCIDRSAGAIELAEKSAALNGVEATCRFVRGEAFSELGRRGAEGDRFELVIADPPAFVKSKKDLNAGLKGYRKMIRLAASVVAPDGWLLAASCSHHVDASQFAEVIRGGLRDARRSGRIVNSGGAGPDHPVHPYLPESAYLKSALLRLD